MAAADCSNNSETKNRPYLIAIHFNLPHYHRFIKLFFPGNVFISVSYITIIEYLAFRAMAFSVKSPNMDDVTRSASVHHTEASTGNAG